MERIEMNEPTQKPIARPIHATIYIRVPWVLKRDTVKAAQKAKLSVNMWVIECFESCLKEARRGR
jgi:predicted HicB family RNase H-like nuclease